MALSYYSNWPPFDHEPLDSDHISLADQIIVPQMELTQDHNNYDIQLQAYPHNNYNLFEFNYSENPNCNNSLLHDFSNGTLVTPYHNHILQKCFDSHHEIIYSDNDDHFINPSYDLTTTSFQDCSPTPDQAFVLPDFPTGPPGYSGGSCGSLKVGPTGGGGLSAQSVAARQRRRKITEKTQELGRLVPGGHKMNTAEMLRAAYKYIQFLRGQVAILEFVASYHQEKGETFEGGEELESLLESSVIQEKLYTAEKCLVPKKFVDEISCDHQIAKCNPQLPVIYVKEEQ